MGTQAYLDGATRQNRKTSAIVYSLRRHPAGARAWQRWHKVRPHADASSQVSHRIGSLKRPAPERACLWLHSGASSIMRRWMFERTVATGKGHEGPALVSCRIRSTHIPVSLSRAILLYSMLLRARIHASDSEMVSRVKTAARHAVHESLFTSRQRLLQHGPHVLPALRAVPWLRDGHVHRGPQGAHRLDLGQQHHRFGTSRATARGP